MALSYGFFNAEMVNGQYDRVYAAEQFAEYFQLFVKNGVFPTPATQLQVIAHNPANMQVLVDDGYGWINGYYAKNVGDYPLNIATASGTQPRIDSVVLRWKKATRSMELAVKKGTPAAAPVRPATTRNADVYELVLAEVRVNAGATSISQSNITDTRANNTLCGWVTGAVQNIDTTNLFAQYNTAFDEWFSNIKNQLSGNVATNLQNQIDKLVTRATNLENKFTTKTVVTKVEMITESTVWIKPSNLQSQSITVSVIGGGGGCGAYNFGGGGGGHYALKAVNVANVTRVPITIGKGGRMAAIGSESPTREAINGGTTSFGTFVSAAGGETTTSTNGGSGGSGGGGGAATSSTYQAGAGGNGNYFGGGGGGSCHAKSGAANNTAAAGGNGGLYGGGGGGGGGGGRTGTVVFIGGPGGAKGANGGAGGKGGDGGIATSLNGKAGAAGAAGVNTTDTTNIEPMFRGTGAAGGGGAAGTNTAGTANRVAGGGGGGGGGGYGGAGGKGGSSSAGAASDISCGGGGGGGFGGKGGDGGLTNPNGRVNGSAGGGGGYGPIKLTQNSAGGTGFGAGGGWSKYDYGKADYLYSAGAPGICILTYNVLEVR